LAISSATETSSGFLITAKRQPGMVQVSCNVGRLPAHAFGCCRRPPSILRTHQ
jgi:hypothetical protein